MTNLAGRSHADDQGAAIELLTAMLTGDDQAARRAVRVVHRSAAEAGGLAVGLARITVVLLRHVAASTDDDAIGVLKGLAPQLHADALELDATLDPPLPGSAALKQMEPPDLGFLTGEILKNAGAVLSGAGITSLRRVSTAKSRPQPTGACSSRSWSCCRQPLTRLVGGRRQRSRMEVHRARRCSGGWRLRPRSR